MLEPKIIRKKVKYARIKVKNDDSVELILPLNYPKTLAFKFYEENLEWIKGRILANQKRKIPDGKAMLLGEIYTLNFDDSLKGCEILGGEILAKNEDKFLKFKRKFAKEFYLEKIEKFSPYIGRSIARLSVKSMQTRWGSCNSKKGYINLSLNLIERKIPLIEYVVLHELTHLLYPHHQKSFYEFIAKIMPDFRQREKELKNPPIFYE